MEPFVSSLGSHLVVLRTGVGQEKLHFFLNLKIKFFCLKVGCWVEVVSTSLSGFRNEIGVFINLQNTTTETRERPIPCTIGYTEKKLTNVHIFSFLKNIIAIILDLFFQFNSSNMFKKNNRSTLF